jgi:hypothetical protein
MEGIDIGKCQILEKTEECTELILQALGRIEQKLDKPMIQINETEGDDHCKLHGVRDCVICAPSRACTCRTPVPVIMGTDCHVCKRRIP